MKRSNTIFAPGTGTSCVLAFVVCLLFGGFGAQAATFGAAGGFALRLSETLQNGGDLSGGDLDGDHLADLVVTSRGQFSSPTLHTLEISLSHGTEKQTFHFSSRRGGLTVTARDVDGDQDLDIVITSRVTGEGVGILINNGEGTFSVGELQDRRPWVWGHGAGVVAGTQQENTLALSPSGNDDAFTSQQCQMLSLHRTTTVQAGRQHSVRLITCGAFRIRPPPASHA